MRAVDLHFGYLEQPQNLVPVCFPFLDTRITIGAPHFKQATELLACVLLFSGFVCELPLDLVSLSPVNINSVTL
jgi:hypothetical protein